MTSSNLFNNLTAFFSGPCPPSAKIAWVQHGGKILTLERVKRHEVITHYFSTSNVEDPLLIRLLQLAPVVIECDYVEACINQNNLLDPTAFEISVTQNSKPSAIDTELLINVSFDNASESGESDRQVSSLLLSARAPATEEVDAYENVTSSNDQHSIHFQKAASHELDFTKQTTTPLVSPPPEHFEWSIRSVLASSGADSDHSSLPLSRPDAFYPPNLDAIVNSVRFTFANAMGSSVLPSSRGIVAREPFQELSSRSNTPTPDQQISHSTGTTSKQLRFKLPTPTPSTLNSEPAQAEPESDSVDWWQIPTSSSTLFDAILLPSPTKVAFNPREPGKTTMLSLPHQTKAHRISVNDFRKLVPTLLPNLVRSDKHVHQRNIRSGLVKVKIIDKRDK
ncbi:hypothetical protein OIO90_000671 [Microbotryomycetes sp. JL221]|nr:hypothetical protein OIO90_000671 [Microbotryomycetes sp. JL221]